MTSDDIREIYQVIGILDGYAAKLACEKLTAQDFADMEFYIDTMDLALNSGNYDMYHKQQIVFHQLYLSLIHIYRRYLCRNTLSRKVVHTFHMYMWITFH